MRRLVAGIAMVLLTLMAAGTGRATAAPMSEQPDIFGPLINTGMIIGPPETPEVTINKLHVGPRGWVFGNTEEVGGYLFMIDPETFEKVVWDAGRTEPAEGYQYAGEISDFAVWEESGRLIILAGQAYPAEIYRYEVTIPAQGLPDMSRAVPHKVHANTRWDRVMSIEVGKASDGSRRILAGSLNYGEVIRSDDAGLSWSPVSYFDGASDLDSARHQPLLTYRATITQLQYVGDTWFLFTKLAWWLADEPCSRIACRRHHLNGILYSKDGGTSWKLAQVEPNPRLPDALRQTVEAERNTGRLHPRLYDLVGEAGIHIEEMDDGELLMTISVDNIMAFPFGGRILGSRDGGLSWSERFYFEQFRDLRIRNLGNGRVLAGTMTKTTRLLDGPAVGELWISSDRASSFSFLRRVVESDKPSVWHRGYYITGVSAMATTPKGVIVGTVKEGAGERAEVFLLPPATTKYADDTAAGIRYVRWNGVADSSASGGGYRTANWGGDTLVYHTTVATDTLSLITYRGPNQGFARVYIDGVNKGVLDLYHASPQYQHLQSFTGLANRPHTIAIQAFGQKNPLSTGSQVRVDGFRVGNTIIEDSSPEIRYRYWIGASNQAAFGGSYRYTATTNGYVVLQARGTQFTWITARGPSFGKAQISVDGTVVSTVDLYHPTPQWQYHYAVRGLTPGSHVVQIKALGTRNAQSTGNTIVFDGYSVP